VAIPTQAVQDRHVSWRVSNVPLPEPHLLGIAVGVWLHRMRPWVLPGPGQVDLEHPDGLVTSGPYAVSRNPMYTGWALFSLGAGVAGGAGWIVAALPAAVGWVHWEILREERALGEDFGDEFGRYRAAVPRYLPGWPTSWIATPAYHPPHRLWGLSHLKRR
jgi:protein-S-isoprenylcysteine O-methyltransferase Ste14